MSWALFMLMGLMLCTNLMRMFLIFWVSEIVSIISGRLFVEASKTLGLKLVQSNFFLLQLRLPTPACDIQQLEPQTRVLDDMLVSGSTDGHLSHIQR